MFLMIKFWNWQNEALRKSMCENIVKKTGPIVAKLGVRDMEIKCLFPLLEIPPFGYNRCESIIEIILSCKQSIDVPDAKEELIKVIGDIARQHSNKLDLVVTNKFFMFIPC